MRKIFSSLVFICAITFCASAQELEKVIQEFEKMTNDPKMIYGRNKAAGKFYDIRGFKMYAEVYGQGKPLLLIHGNSGSIKNFFTRYRTFQKNIK